MSDHAPVFIGGMFRSGKVLNALIFIDHDIMIRHFVDSGVFNSLGRTHEITLVVPTDKKRVKRVLTSETVGFNVVELPTDSKRQFLWQTLFMVTQVRPHWGRHSRSIRGIYRINLPKRVLFLYMLLGLPGVYSVFKYWLKRALRGRPCTAIERLIEESKPDVIIHPSVLAGVYINDLTEIARARGLPLVVIMNSWDNPCTKRVMVGTPDWLLVWGEQTKRHAIDYIGMRPERVVKFGVAQFDLYRSPTRITRREFCRQHGIDTERTILLYAGSSKGTD